MTNLDIGVGLAELLADPARAAAVPREAVLGLLVELAAEQVRMGTVERLLLARLAADAGNGIHEDRLLALEEAAELLHVTPDWLRRQRALPFRVEVSAGQVRYSTRGLERFIATRMRR